MVEGNKYYLTVNNLFIIQSEICKKFHKEIESSEDYLGVSKGENVVDLSKSNKEIKRNSECCGK